MGYFFFSPFFNLLLFVCVINPSFFTKGFLTPWQKKSSLSLFLFIFVLVRLMENSYNSCMNNTKAVACKGTTDCVPEESGWTKYFEDFSNYREHGFSSCLDNSSLVSDADSCALWKKSHNNLKLPKKTRTKIISVDDSLEDTASSPVSSPKVSDLSPVIMHPRKGKGDTLEHYPELQADERSEVNYSGKNINDCTDLRNRGLCLVPLSKLVNYFG